MRNLKRTLTLLLAAAMVMGLTVVGAGAVSSSDFTDSDEITRVEAAGVMTALGVFEGTDTGAFDPSGTLTREQAAAIICRMLLGSDAEKLTANSAVFSDVAADRWSAGYIGYCAQQGILAGTGAGAFDPTGELTGLAFAKMCLVALGYSADAEGYVGTDWAINVAADAVNAGISPSGIVLANTISREDAAQMAFQTLEADMVTYSGSGSTTVTGADGTTIIITGAAEKVSNSRSDDYRTVSADRDEVQQFCEYYFPNLTKNESGEDAFGRPSVRWLNSRTEIGAFSAEPDASYTAGVDRGELYDVVGRDVYNALAGGDADLTVIVDGEEVDASLSDFLVRNSGDTAGVRSGGSLVSGQRTGNGVLTEVFVDGDTDDVTITLIHTYVAQVDGDYDADDGELNLDALDGAEFDADDYTLYEEDFDNLDSYADGDYVLVTVAGGEIQSITPADTVTGEVTAYTVNSSVTVDGTRYYYNRTFTYAITSDDAEYDLNEDYTLVLDGYGYVVYSDASDGASNYVLIARVAPTGGVNSAYEARAFFQDGTYATIDLDDDSTATIGGTEEENDTLLVEIDSEDYTSGHSYTVVNRWYEYDVNSSGEYELTNIGSDEQMEQVSVEEDEKLDITATGSAYVYYGKNSGERFRADDSTVFVVNDDGDLNAYTGIRSVPDITLRNEGAAVVAWVMDGRYADVVYLAAEDNALKVSGGSSDRVYILDHSSYDRSVDSDGNTYYAYSAIVNGEAGTAYASDKLFKYDALYSGIEYDNDGYVSGAERVTYDIDEGEDFACGTFDAEDEAVVDYSNGVLSFDAMDLVLADDYTIFFNDDGAAETVTTSRLTRDYDGENGDYFVGTVYAYLNDDGEVAEVYVNYTGTDSDDGSDGTEETLAADVEVTYNEDTGRITVEIKDVDVPVSEWSGWTLNAPSVTYTVSLGDEELLTKTHKIDSGRVDVSELELPAVGTLANKERGTYTVEVELTFTGDDGVVYSATGSGDFTIL